MECARRGGDLAAHRASSMRSTLRSRPLDPVPRRPPAQRMLAGVRETWACGSALGSRGARSAGAHRVRARPVRARTRASWPAVDDAALLASLDSWLAPWLDGVTRREHLARVPLSEALQPLLSWQARQKLDELAPAHSHPAYRHRKARIDYLDEGGPSVAVRLQEVFGLRQTPSIGAGAVRVTFKLLSPAQRPVQITRDLAGLLAGARTPTCASRCAGATRSTTGPRILSKRLRCAACVPGRPEVRRSGAYLMRPSAFSAAMT